MLDTPFGGSQSVLHFMRRDLSAAGLPVLLREPVLSVGLCGWRAGAFRAAPVQWGLACSACTCRWPRVRFAAPTSQALLQPRRQTPAILLTADHCMQLEL